MTQDRTHARTTLRNFFTRFFSHPSQSSAGNRDKMYPQRPMAQAVPPTLGQNLRDLAYGFGRGKNLLGGNIAYGVIQSLKECLYFLLCCWCIKEILD